MRSGNYLFLYLLKSFSICTKMTQTTLDEYLVCSSNSTEDKTKLFFLRTYIPILFLILILLENFANCICHTQLQPGYHLQSIFDPIICTEFARAGLRHSVNIFKLVLKLLTSSIPTSLFLPPFHFFLSWNHRMVWVRKDIKDHTVPMPLL